MEEISEAVAIDAERDPAFDRQEALEDPLEVLNICSSLVTIANTKESNRRVWNDRPESARHVVVLAHYSVKEYLTSPRIRQGRASRYSMQDAACNKVIAKSCLGYLLQFQRWNFFPEESIKEFKLAEYSAMCWISHTETAAEEEAEEEAETLSQLIMRLFCTRTGAYLNWIRIYDPDERWRGSDFTRTLERVPAPLYYAAQAGLTEIVSLLLVESEVDVNSQRGKYGNALQVASWAGHDKIVELLLSKRANVNAQGGKYDNALQAASSRGHDKIVELLLSKGADVNAQRGGDRNALQAASSGGHSTTVELLLGKGADGTALQAASSGGHDKIVELLLSKGVQ